MGIFIKIGILHTLKFHLHTLGCHFWLNLWETGSQASGSLAFFAKLSCKPYNVHWEIQKFGSQASRNFWLCWAKCIITLNMLKLGDQCMKWPVAHSPNSTWFWLELVGNCCEGLKIIMKYTNIQFCERLGHGWQFHPLGDAFILHLSLNCVIGSFNSLAPGRFQFNFWQVIFKLTLVNGGWGIS